MDFWDKLISSIGARRGIITLGGIYVMFAAVYPFLPDGPALSIELAVIVLVAGPGLILLYSGYRLPQLDIRAEVYSVVLKWCLGGICVMLGIISLTLLAAGLRSILENLFLLTAISSIAGLAAGIYDARARTRELELEETVEHLRVSNERLEQFAYAASHDLQEPLRMVSSYMQLIDSRYGEQLDDEGREFLDYAVDGSERMREMIDGLLAYSRIETQGDTLEPVSLDTVCEGVLDDLQMKIEEEDAEITSDSLPQVMGDAKQLRRVFQNLLENSIEYTDEDEPPDIHVSANQNDSKWVVSVSDEGIGIGQENQERIFKVFERMHTREEYAGSGIGLSLCQRIIERHGGDIWVDSESDKGTTISFTLPPVEHSG